MRTIQFCLGFLILVEIGMAQSITPKLDTWTTNGPVHSISPQSDGIYIGGEFTYVGPPTGPFAVVDRATGAINALPVPSISMTVTRSIPDGMGGWYVAVKLDPESYQLMRLDDTQDTIWRVDIGNRIASLAAGPGVVYLGGSFDTVGGINRSRLAALDASTGAVLDWNPICNEDVRAMAYDGERLYVGGEFTLIDGAERHGLAALNASTGAVLAWDPVASEQAPRIFVMQVADGVVYVGGISSHIGATPRPNLAAIDAITGIVTDWNPVSNNTVYAIEVSGEQVYLGGNFTTMGGVARERLAAVDRATGAVLPWAPSVNATVAGLSVSGDTVFAVGLFTLAGTVPRQYLAAFSRVEGSLESWDPGVSDFVGDVHATSGQIMLAGNFRSVGGAARSSLAALTPDGKGLLPWQPVVSDTVLALAAHEQQIYAGGPTGLAAFDRTSGAASNLSTEGIIVNALHIKDERLYLAGKFNAIDGQSRYGAAAYELGTGQLSAWKPDLFIFTNTESAIASSPNAIYVGGRRLQGISNVGAVMPYNVIDGTSIPWPEPAQFSGAGNIYALLQQDSILYVGGTFSSVGGQSRSGFALLDADDGTLLETGADVTGSIRSMAASGEFLYLGGSFELLGGLERASLAAFDMRTGRVLPWNPRASDMVNVLAVNGTVLHAGGAFQRIGGAAHGYYAQFELPDDSARQPILVAPSDSMTVAAVPWWFTDFQLDVTEPQSEPFVVIQIEPQSPGHWSGFYRSGTPPLRHLYDRLLSAPGPGGRFEFIMPANGDEYVSIWLSNAAPADLLVTAFATHRHATDIDVRRGGNVGQVTINFTGAGFIQGAMVELRDSTGAVLTSSAATTLSPNQMRVTLTLDSIEPQTTDLMIIWPGEAPQVFRGGFEIVEYEEPPMDFGVITESAIRPNRRYVASLRMQNQGVGNVEPPLFTLDTRGANYWLRMAPHRPIQPAPIIVAGISDGNGQDQLAPGAMREIKGIEYLNKSASQGGFLATQWYANGDAPDWDRFSSSLRPPELADAEWEALRQALPAVMGNTWSELSQHIVERCIAHREARLPDYADGGRAARMLVREMAALPTASLYGRLSESSAGVRIIAINKLDPSIGKETRTESGGYFVMDYLEPGSYELMVEGYMTPAPVLAELPSIFGADIGLVNVSRAGRIKGRIVDSLSSTGLPGVEVRALDPSGSLADAAGTTEDGTFLLAYLPEGQFSLEIRTKTHFHKIIPNVAVQTGAQNNTGNITLDKARMLMGSIADAATGLPIEGAFVSFENLGEAVTACITDAGGAFEAGPLPGGKLLISISHPDYLPQSTYFLTTQGEQLAAVSLHAAARISGRVLNAQGAPIAFARVLAGVGDESKSSAFSFTDETGNFNATGLCAGTYNLYIQAEGYAPRMLQAEASTGEPLLLDIVLSLGRTVNGVVLLPDNATPAPGARIQVYDGLGYAAETTSAADGSFNISGAPDGSLQFRIEMPDVGALHLESSAGEIEGVLPSGARIHGTLLAGDCATPLENGIVTIWDETLATRMGSAVSGENGEFVIGGLAAGEYVLHMQQSGYTFETETVQLTEDAVVPIQACGGTASLSGTVTLPDGAPVADAKVSAILLSAPPLKGAVSVSTGENGGYVLSGLAEGQYVVLIDKPSYTPSISLAEVDGPSQVLPVVALAASFMTYADITSSQNGEGVAFPLVQLQLAYGPYTFPLSQTILDENGHGVIEMPAMENLAALISAVGYAPETMQLDPVPVDIFESVLTPAEKNGLAEDSAQTAWAGGFASANSGAYPISANDLIWHAKTIQGRSLSLPKAADCEWHCPENWKDEQLALLHMPPPSFSPSCPPPGLLQPKDCDSARARELIEEIDSLNMDSEFPCSLFDLAALEFLWRELNRLIEAEVRLCSELNAEYAHACMAINAFTEAEKCKIGEYIASVVLDLQEKRVKKLFTELKSVRGLKALKIYGWLNVSETIGDAGYCGYLFWDMRDNVNRFIDTADHYIGRRTMYNELKARYIKAYATIPKFNEKMEKLTADLRAERAKENDDCCLSENAAPCEQQQPGCDNIAECCKQCEYTPQRTVVAVDPNEKLSSDGCGPKHLILDSEPLVYTVLFENLPSSSAAAQEVFITDALSENLDWNTVQLMNVGWGEHNVDLQASGTDWEFTETVADYRPEVSAVWDLSFSGSLSMDTGEMFFTFRTLDPQTGDLPTDAFAGFLPPNDETHRGEGRITFQVYPAAALELGTVIENSASIVFDSLTSISTNTVTNTLSMDNLDVVVPNLANLNRQQAEETLVATGLVPVVRVRSEGEGNPLVKMQNISPGSQITCGSSVEILLGEAPTEGEGEGRRQTVDQDGDFIVSLSELLRVIQFYNSLGLHCADVPTGTEDGYVPGGGGNQSCPPYDTDYSPQNWVISLSELLRVIQFYNTHGYHYCPLDGTEDGFCPGP